jgi:predicted GIY-YIG superfamily endonuclease
LGIKTNSSGDSRPSTASINWFYYEIFGDLENAILREKPLKGSSRARKNKLVEEFNPGWSDLYDKI